MSRALYREFRYVDRSAPLQAGERLVGMWPRRARFLFIMAAASLCWAVPLAVVYLLAFSG